MVDVKEVVRRHGLDRYPNVVGYSLKLKNKVKGGVELPVPSLRIYVSRKLPLEKLRKDEVIPREVEGIPTDIIEVGRLKRLEGFRERYRPSPCGVSTSRADEEAAGTIGWWMVDEDGLLYLMSNNHVWAKENNASPGDEIIQPGRLDGGDPEEDVIAELASWIDIDFAGGVNKVDVAIAQPYIPQTYTSIMEKGGAAGKRDPQLNEEAVKVGRTTGVTEGVVKDDSATLQVEYATGTALFEDVFIVEGVNVVKNGDSGSPVLGSDMCFLGLLFAGNEEGSLFVACKTSNIEAELQAKLAKKIWVLTVNTPIPFQKEVVERRVYVQTHPLVDLALATTVLATAKGVYEALKR